MKNLLGDFNVKVGRENIFKPTDGNENLQLYSKDNVVRVVNFTTLKNVVLSVECFRTGTFKSTPGTFLFVGKTHSQNDHILTDRRRRSSILHVRSFGVANCDSDHYLVVAKLAVSEKQHRSLMWRDLISES
jgi:endonuclease/exonuclease/phosphatase family metal-dependent hydrolase